MQEGPSIRIGDQFTARCIVKWLETSVVAVAEGTQADHVHHHWVHDALHLHSETGCTAHGLVGIPMRKIEVAVLDGDSTALTH